MAMVVVAEKELLKLWNDLAGNRRNRALVMARVVANHGDEALRAHYTQKIRLETFPCDEREEALRILAPNNASIWLSQVIASQPPPETRAEPIRMDVESGRLAIALHKAAEFRLWSIGRELVRQDQGSGKVPRKALYEALEGFQIGITRDHYSRLLRQGRGLFWRIDEVTETIYINSPRQVAPRLVEAALTENPQLVATNLPGGRDMYISVSDSHETFEANLYAGWMSYRENPTISREVLTTLFNRSGDSLRRWEQKRLQNSLTVRENYAQYEPNTDNWERFIPDHARPYLANVRREGHYGQVVRYRWRIPNTYKTTNIRQHPKRGQNYKVFALVKHVLDQATGGSNRSAAAGQPTYFFGRAFEKLYFHDGKQIKRYIQRKGCSERLLWRGEDKHGRGVFEPTLSYGQTYPNERVRFKEEYRHFKKLQTKLQAFVQMQTLAS